jgi:cation diffusion facilitator CzcD-associated flavoprotein CzcO
LTVPTEHIDTVIIGAGQSGLTASYHLSRKGVPHVVLERGRVGERWRSERWDNLHFQFPAWHCPTNSVQCIWSDAVANFKRRVDAI